MNELGRIFIFYYSVESGGTAKSLESLGINRNEWMLKSIMIVQIDQKRDSLNPNETLLNSIDI